MKETKQEKLNLLSSKIDALINHTDLLDKQIKKDFEEIFEFNKKAFEIYTDIKKGDLILYRDRMNRKEKLHTGIFNGFSRSGLNRTYYFSLLNDKNEIVFKRLMQMSKDEFDSFSKVIKLKNPFDKK